MTSPLREGIGAPSEDSMPPRFDFHLHPAPRLLWKTRIGDSYGGARPCIADGRLYAWDREDRLVLLDAATGEVLGRRRILDGVKPATPSLDGETLCLSACKHGERGAYLCAYKWSNAELLWAKQTRSYWMPPYARNGMIWAATADNYVHALRSKDGSAKWSHRLRSSYRGASLTIADDTLYVGGAGKAGFKSQGKHYDFQMDGYVLALAADTGEIRWMYATRGEVQEAPEVADGRVYVGEVSSKSRCVYCLAANPGSRLGKRLWRYELDGLPQQGIVCGNSAYWGCYNGYLNALDAQSGQPRWRFQAGASMADSGPACVLQDWVFVGAEDDYLYGLDRRTGALRWKHYVLDDDALMAENEEEAQRIACFIKEFESLGKEEQMEWFLDEFSNGESCEEEAHQFIEEYKDLGKDEQMDWLRNKLSAAVRSDDAGPGDRLSLSPFAWVAEKRLYLLTQLGFLTCFELPQPASKGEAIP